jgi:crotonobetainyl-CoA:carnitine CoA-transferase CaiB-like acyl-CoA transferase
VKNRELVDLAVGAWFAERGHDEALKIMRDAGATVGPVYSAADAAHDVHFAERGVVVDVEDDQFGSLPMHNILPRLSATPGTFRRPAPTLGEHTAEILAEIGLTP